MPYALTMSREDEKSLANLVTGLTKNLSIYDWKNGHVSDRLKTNVKRMTICIGNISPFGEPVIDFHTYAKDDMDNELKFSVTKVGEEEVELDFTIGGLTDEALELILQEVNEAHDKVKESATEKRRRAKLSREEKKLIKFSTKSWRGLYIYRGKIDESSEHWKNYEEAVRLNIASSEFIQSMKDWNLHFQKK